jgi:hypothetical protein
MSIALENTRKDVQKKMMLAREPQGKTPLAKGIRTPHLGEGTCKHITCMLTEENQPVAIPKIQCDIKSQNKNYLKFRCTHQPGLQREREVLHLSLRTAWHSYTAWSLQQNSLYSAAPRETSRSPAFI